MHRFVNWARPSTTGGVGFIWVIAALPVAWEAEELSGLASWGKMIPFYFVVSRKPAPYGQRKLGNRPGDTFEEMATWESNGLAVGIRSREDTIVDFYLLSCHTSEIEYSS